MQLIDHLDVFEEAKLSKYKSSAEEIFLQELEEKYDRYGNATFLSEKQLAWLTQIADR